MKRVKCIESLIPLAKEIFLLYFYLMKKMFAYNPEVFQWR